MKIEIVNQLRNELLKREEVSFKLDHEEAGTPPRTVVKQRLADMLGAGAERLYLIKYETKTGSMTAVGEARIYDTVEQAKYAEPEYIIQRNSPKEEKQE
ncbi:MAG: 30S ribosomal protein S24e [Candidatus Bathyarchaeota archaeon]|nr:30S ribosomal protein S24e [Candidatus Bathyarchaeota archaeon]